MNIVAVSLIAGIGSFSVLLGIARQFLGNRSHMFLELAPAVFACMTLASLLPWQEAGRDLVTAVGGIATALYGIAMFRSLHASPLASQGQQPQLRDHESAE